MDAISYSYADKQAKRIKKFINDPDSTSGVLTVPKVIASGESVTIPAGRIAILPNVQVDGTLNVQGDVFIPSGATMSKVVEKVTSTDNAVVRFNGTTGEVQNSGVIIDDNNDLTLIGNLKFGNGNQIISVSDTNSLQLNAASASGNIMFSVAGSERVRVDANGNVGIGVTPSAVGTGFTALQIKNCVNIVGVTGADRYELTNAYFDGAAWRRINATQKPTRFTTYDGSYVWGTAAAGSAGSAITFSDVMTLDASGNLNVGGGTDNWVQASSTGGNSYTYIRGRATSGTTEVFYSAVGGVLKAQILSNGSYQSALGAGAMTGTSDIKLKENIKDSSNKLDRLMKVRVVDYNMINDVDKQKQIGVIAQEIEQIFPGMVYEIKDTKQIEVKKERIIPAIEEIKDDEGNILQKAIAESIEEYIDIETIETGSVTKVVKYGVFTMLMLKGMQEMRAEYTAKIEAMQIEINELKGAK